MKTTNTIGDTLGISVCGYHLPDSIGVLYASDWLDATLTMSDGRSKDLQQLEFLVIEELERMVDWLSTVSNGCFDISALEFIDPAMEMAIINQNNGHYLRFSYQFETNPTRTWDILADVPTLNQLTTEIQMILDEFPCRCGQLHDKLTITTR